jgi:hypothetical protein
LNAGHGRKFAQVTVLGGAERRFTRFELGLETRTRCGFTGVCRNDPKVQTSVV